MCRLAAYLGPETSLHHIVFDTNHSLEKQAWQPKELREAKLNVDGFGFGWFNENGQLARYRQTLPIWGDANLRDFCHSLQRPLWLCYIRSATPGLGTSLTNTQPFSYQSWQFLHNGYINNFSLDIRSRIRHFLPHSLESLIDGNTDSEYLFVLILHFFQQSNDMPGAIREAFKQLKKWLEKERALLNIILSDGDQIIASSYAINGESPSLYYGKDIEGFPKESQLLVSEKLNDDEHWQAIPAGSLIRLRAGLAVEIKTL
ncbi:MAG: ergothioneine biosynthesis protein EgtC [Gammaproteobacteria bacterium]|nr:ergothioneine biosynthesis protein EgtC [Gammaproteobacteria bacterium]